MAKLNYQEMKNKRVELDMTQRDLAERSGVNINSIRAMETGRMIPEADSLAAILAVLELPIDKVYFPDYRDTQVISVLNNKGGCGKTSICSSIGYILAEMGYKILLIDADAQRNLSSSYDMKKSPKNFGAAILAEEPLTDYIQPTGYQNIDMIVADVSMGTMDMQLFTKVQRENVVRQCLMPVVDGGAYDFILIDTNPNLSLLNFNIINASHGCIIPVQPAGFDVEGIVTVIDFIKGVMKFNTTLRILGIVMNRYDMRNRSISEAASLEIEETYGELLFETVIHVDVKIQNAQWENKPVFVGNSSRITKEFRALAKEVVKRCQK